MKQNTDTWLADPTYKGIIIMDPDGWDRKRYLESWAEEIDEEEFVRRLGESTLMFGGVINGRRSRTYST